MFFARLLEITGQKNLWNYFGTFQSVLKTCQVSFQRAQLSLFLDKMQTNYEVQKHVGSNENANHFVGSD